MADQNYEALIEFLTDKHGKILESETVALESLKNADKDAYKAKMTEKARLLADLADECKPMTNNLPADKKDEVASEIKRFSDAAAAALNLDSVFYMSALLYRDDHKEGQPDNLLVFIEKLKNN